MKATESRYVIAYKKTLGALRNQVNALIEVGWVPQGGLTIDPEGYYMQAMYLPEARYVGLAQ